MASIIKKYRFIVFKLDQKTDAIVVLNMVLAALTGVEFVASQQLIAAKVPILR